jgi:hypothetical protein
MGLARPLLIDQMNGWTMKATILHITDLHVGQPAGKARWQALAQAFRKDLVMEVDPGKIDIVLLTGDLAYSGTHEQFDDVTNVLTDFLQDFMDPTPAIIALPGNHDLQRPSVDDAASIISKNPDSYRRYLRGLLKDPERSKPPWSAFSCYSSWQNNCPFAMHPVKEGLFPGDAAYSVITEIGPITVVALNTAISQLAGGNYETKLVILSEQIDQLVSAARELPAPSLTVLAHHHPRSWLDEKSRDDYADLVQALGVEPGVTFSGHRHVRRYDIITRNGESHGLNIIGPSLFGLETTAGGHSRIHGYSVTQFSSSSEWLSYRLSPRAATKRDDGAMIFGQERTSGIDLEAQNNWTNEFALSPHPASESLPMSDTTVTPDDTAGTPGDGERIHLGDDWILIQHVLETSRAVANAARDGDSPKETEFLTSLGQSPLLGGIPKISPARKDVIRGYEVAASRWPNSTVRPNRFVDASADLRQGANLFALILDFFNENSVDAPLEDAQDSPEACFWAWQELILRGLPERDALGTEGDKHSLPEWLLAMPGPERRRWSYHKTASSPSTDAEICAAAMLKERLDDLLEDDEPSSPTEAFQALDALLPKRLVEATRRRLSHGGRRPSLTEYQNTALPMLKEALERSENVLLSAVTGSGKSLIGQIAAAHVVSSRRGGRKRQRAVIAVPLKALVDDVVRDLRNWFDDADMNYHVLGASRDYPENRESLAAKRFEVAVEIYESLAVAISSGQDPLRNCGVLVVDELQYIAHESRGARLESLIVMVRARYPKLPIIGISAVLSAESRLQIADWLNVNPRMQLHTGRRPVSLDVYAYDGSEWLKRRDTLAVGTTATAAESLDAGSLNLQEKLAAWRSTDASEHGILRPSISAGSTTTPALVLHLLQQNPDHRILVYTNSRSSAQRLAGAIQFALDAELGRIRRTARNPWRDGRFASTMLAPGVAEKNLECLRRTAAHEGRKDVETALMTGCAYHTRQLTRPLRELVEEEFRSGLLRVLVTTDTLSVGLNLPVNTVVVATPTVSTGSARGFVRSLDVGEVKNRIGRAGRLGLTEHGDAWILTGDADFLSKRLDRHDARTADELTSLPGVANAYVASNDSGTTVRSCLEGEDLELLILQDYHNGRRRIRREAVNHAELLMRHTLRFALDSRLPASGESVVDRLLDRQLLQAVGDSVMASPLGVAIAINNMPVSVASSIVELSDFAYAKAEPVDLLTIAISCSFVNSDGWLSLSPWEPDWTYGEFEVKTGKNAQRLCAPLFVTGEERHRAFAELKRQLVESDPHVAFGEVTDSLLKTAPASPEGPLAQCLQRATGSIRDANIAFRVFLCLLWQNSVPFREIGSFLESATRFSKARRKRSKGRFVEYVRRIEVHYADVETFADQVSIVLATADTFSRARTDGKRPLTLGAVAESLRFGVPAWASPLLELRIPALHRERVLCLGDDAPGEELYEILNDPRLELNATEIEQAMESLEAGSRGPRTFGLPDAISSREVAGDMQAPTYGDFYVDLTQASSSTERLDYLCDLFRYFGLGLVREADARIVSTDGRLSLQVSEEKLQSAEVASYFNDMNGDGRSSRIILALAGLSARAAYVSRVELSSGMLIFPGLDSLLVFLDRCTQAARNGGRTVDVTLWDAVTSGGGLRVFDY